MLFITIHNIYTISYTIYYYSQYYYYSHKIINFRIQFTCLFDLNPNFFKKLPLEDVVCEELRKLGQIKTKFRKTYLILFKT